MYVCTYNRLVRFFYSIGYYHSEFLNTKSIVVEAQLEYRVTSCRGDKTVHNFPMLLSPGDLTYILLPHSLNMSDAQTEA